MNQALKAGRIASKNENQIKKILDEVGKMVSKIPMGNTPPETGMLIYKKISEITGNFDPYKEIKKKNMDEAISLLPMMEEFLNNSEDRLLAAIRLAIAGNVIDLGVNREFDIKTAIEEVFDQDFAICDYDDFKQKLSESEEILYLGDNSGEAVFDKILIREIGKPVIYVVKENPIINDITLEEAKYLEIDKIAKIISSGMEAPGTIIKMCNKDFIKKFNEAKIIISKGQGNYEGLSGIDAPIFFMLRAKCPVIARDINVSIDSIILENNKRSER
jgi:uncharacterized protein with ATP-grasp and redox domains